MKQELRQSIKHPGLIIVIIAVLSTVTYAQSPSPTPKPDDKRGIGIQSTSRENSSQPGPQSRETKPELVLQSGYNSFFGATRMVFSPDGRLLATATFRSSTIKLWETATGRELRNLSSGKQSAAGMSPYIAFSRDGRVVAAAAGDNSVKIWDVITGREVQTLASQQGSQASIAASLGGVYFIAFSADGRVVTISDAIKVWDLATGRELRSMPLEALSASGFTGGEGGAALSADGNQLAFITADGQIKFWDLATGQEARVVSLSDKDVENAELVFAADGRLLAAGTVDKRLKLWDVTTKGKERDLGPTTAEFGLVRFSRDGRLLAFSEGYSVKLWEVATGRELSSLKAPNSGLFVAQGRVFASFAEDGKRIATGGFDTPTILWETDTGKQLLKMNGRTNMAYKVAFSADGHQLSSGGRTRWDLRTGSGLRINAKPLMSAFAIPSPDGRLLAAFTPNSNTLTILETPSGRVLKTLSPNTGGGVVQRASFSPDGSMIVTTYGPNDQQVRQPLGQAPGNENQVKIWEVKSGRELHSLALGNAPFEVGFSGDGRVLATIGSMGQVSLWDTQSGSRLRDLTPSPLANMGSLGSIGSMKPGQIKPGSLPSVSGMPNIADLSAMMTNVMGCLRALWVAL